MSRSRTAAFWLAVAFVILIVVALVSRKRRFTQSVNSIVLISDDYDPNSIIRGQTLRLHYPINTVRTAEFKPWPVKPGQVIYAELAPEATTWSLVGVQSDPPSEIAEGYAVLRGTIQAGTQWESHPVNQLMDYSDPGWLTTQAPTAAWRNYSRGFGQQETGFYYLGHLPEGTTVYVILNNFGNGEAWNQVGIIDNLGQVPNPGGPNSRTIILQGILGPAEAYKILYIQYGLETYHVAEDIDRTMTRGRFRVEVTIDADGMAAIKSAKVVSEPPATIPSAPTFSTIPSADH